MVARSRLTTAIKAHVDIVGEVTIKWCDDAEIRELNYQFRGVDKATNVLAFPNEESSLSPWERAGVRASSKDDTDPSPPPNPLPEGGGIYLGDLAISLETIEREAAEQGKDPAHHLAHMVIHGVLHLVGYDHENDADAAVMEALESSILAQLGIDNPYI